MTSGPKQPYNEDEEVCDHEFDEDEDALEWVCSIPGCGHREPMDLGKLIR